MARMSALLFFDLRKAFDRVPISALISATDQWYHLLEGFFVEFKKAIDSVPHRLYF